MGQNEFELKALGDDALLAGLSRIVSAHQRVTAKLLAYLLELDERKLFLDLGYPSLFDYCVKALGLCESTAGRHIAAARACRFHGQAIAMVARGELHASALSQMNKHLNSGNAEELVEACRNKSARRVEEELAARFPRGDVPDAITPNVGSQRLEPLSADRYGVHFTADSEFRDLLDRVRGLAGHRLPNGDLMTLMKRGLEAYERELEKERFGVGRKARRGQASAVPESAAAEPAAVAEPTVVRGARARKRRHPRAAVAREVYLRDEGQCSWVSADGRRCSSRFCLQIDHVEPVACQGADTVSNQRLLCRSHNLQHARHCFGAAKIQAEIGGR